MMSRVLVAVVVLAALGACWRARSDLPRELRDLPLPPSNPPLPPPKPGEPPIVVPGLPPGELPVVAAFLDGQPFVGKPLSFHGKVVSLPGELRADEAPGGILRLLYRTPAGLPVAAEPIGDVAVTFAEADVLVEEAGDPGGANERVVVTATGRLVFFHAWRALEAPVVVALWEDGPDPPVLVQQPAADAPGDPRYVVTTPAPVVVEGSMKALDLLPGEPITIDTSLGPIVLFIQTSERLQVPPSLEGAGTKYVLRVWAVSAAP